MNIFLAKLNDLLKPLSLDMTQVASHTIPFEFVHPTKSFFISLCNFVSMQFSSETTILQLDSPLVTVGDIHGHYLDLIRILQNCGHPSKTKYLFLGDLIDRGEYSFETVYLLFLMKACYPNNIFMIRGNHEFDSICSKYGFDRQLYSEYQDHRIYASIIKTFSYMPIAAVVDKVTICVHGGIGPDITSIDSLQTVKRPIDNFDDLILAPLFWSDPDSTVADFMLSPRGIGYKFGETNLLNFLEQSEAARIVRGHEFVPQGILTLFDDRLVTIFSASNYCGTMGNDSAVLVMDPDGDDEIKRFPPLPYLKRCFVKITTEVDLNLKTPLISPSHSTGSMKILRKGISDGSIEKPRVIPHPKFPHPDKPARKDSSKCTINQSESIGSKILVFRSMH